MTEPTAEKRPTNASPSPKRFWTAGSLPLLLTALLACAAALCFRPSAGRWMMFPVYPVCVGLAALLPGKRWARATLFLALTAFLNLVEADTVPEALFVLGAAAVFFVLVELAVWCFRRKKRLTAALGVVMAVGCLCANALLFGDPISAALAQKKIDAYIEQTYDVETGGHLFDVLRFDTRHRVYTLSAACEKYPNLTGEIFVSGDYVVDHYKTLLESLEMQDPASAVLSALADAFPNDTFHVDKLGIDGLIRPGTHYSIYNETDYGQKTSFCVRLSGTISEERLFERAQNYLDVLSGEGVPFGDIVFVGGVGIRCRPCLTPVDRVGLFYDGLKKGMYVMRHPENYAYLATNGLLDCIDCFAEKE